MTQPRKAKDLSREEDYRDYEERDGRDGWPYSDGNGAGPPSPKNRGYGVTPANFDEEPDPGFIVDAADTTGLEEDTARGTGPLPANRIDSDQLEAAITEQLDQSDQIDVGSIDVHVEHGVVTLEGRVETDTISRDIEALVLSMPGVTDVRNNLRTIGVDSHIPPDA
ncbi:BON domain-containing protein [Rhizobium rhizogenes]|uniref:BON domain-containing protein n=1 Tax=Rhizobium rhizogenes TaxID=359 RepID=UPI001572DA15|nr:BON domain-containing protein [Rhizobium rhizogenes]NTI32959.1 BON domain-containing protein [Rhizobium rhizogenes]